jgi:hypothetical protein
MSDAENEAAPDLQQQAAVPIGAAPSSAHLRLPDFWPDTPQAWFIFVESKFHVRGISSEADRFDLVVGSLPKESLRQVIDVLENPDAATPYTTLKGRLLSAHEPTTFQRIEMLHKMEPLGGRKPSELMAHMLELCPRGQEKNEFFLFLFLQRLPRELWVLLGDDFAEPRDLAARADRLWAMHSHDHALIATLQGEEPSAAPVAAVQGGGQRPQAARGRGTAQRSRGSRGSGNGGGGGQRAANPAAFANAPGTLARFATGLCHFHWTYGNKATKCESPCSWGN